MEPWQYSALQTQFSSLLQLLSSSSQNSRVNTTAKDNSTNGQAMNIDCYNDKALCKTGTKRKLSDSDDQDNIEHQYLCKGWSEASHSGEPLPCLSSELSRNSDNPEKPAEDKIAEAAREFLIGINAALKSESREPFYINIKHDVWHYVSHGKGTTSNHRGHMLYEKEDFSRLMQVLSNHWWYYLDEHGQGQAVYFPVKIKPVVTWASSHFIWENNQLQNAPRIQEKLCATIVRRCCDRPKKTSFQQRIGGYPKLVLDVYTQTTASYVADQNSSLAKLADLVLENARRLDSIENLLTKMERKISIFGSDFINIDKDAKKPALTIEVKPSSSFESVTTPATPSTPGSFMSDTETTLGQTENAIKSPMTTVGSPLRLQGIPITVQSSPDNSWSGNPAMVQSVMQGVDSSSKLTSQESRTDSQTKGLDIDGASNILVPVIFASDDKTRRCSTAEVSLQDLLNGNVTNPEDNIQVFRGSWLGDRLDPHSRVWYYGDFKIIQRAEASGSNPAKLSLNLLEALFTREEMASSNVNGARGRDLLDPIKIKAIYVHINYKFPTDPDKQELRWHFLKPRIDSKCRAQRRIQRDHQAVGDGHQSNKERPFRSKLSKPSIDPRIKEELLYGLMKPDAASNVPSQVVSEVINGSRVNGDTGNSEMSGNVQTSVIGQTSLAYGNSKTL